MLALYVGQGIIIHLRLNQLGATRIAMTFAGENCNEQQCRGDWVLTPKEPLLLLGHILQTHRLTKFGSTEPVFPVSEVDGTSTNSWNRLRVYRVKPGEQYQLTAEKPRGTKLGYFIGILPRTSSHDGLLSIPGIGPYISTITGLASLVLLLALLSAAWIGRNDHGISRNANRPMLDILFLSAALATIATTTSLGILDSLLPEGEWRSKLIRLSIVAAVLLPVFSNMPWMMRDGTRKKILLAFFAVAVVGNGFWPWLRGGPTWAITLAAFLTVAILALAKRGHNSAAILVGLGLIDALRMLGYLQGLDYPPLFLLNGTLVAAFTIIASDIGGLATITMAGAAYRRFRRDLGLAHIQETLNGLDRKEETKARAEMIAGALPHIAALSGAGRVTVTISLPLGRPFTQTYDTKTGEVITFDDGKIIGPVILRAMVYGDEAMFETYVDFATRMRLPLSPHLSDASYFCACQLKVNGAPVGALMLTRFNDEFIGGELSKWNDSDILNELGETIEVLADRINSALSTLMVQDLDTNTSRSKDLQSALHPCIGEAASADDFLQRYTTAIGASLGVRAILHEQRDRLGEAISQYGMSEQEMSLFVDAPFNLSADAAPAYGPTVVAFRDGKSSYLKDIHEIFDRLHPKSRAIMTALNVGAIASVPLRASTGLYAITIFQVFDRQPFDPGILRAIESTEALFIAALEVMNQKTSVLALGQIANRLIGDEEVRGQIIKAARSPHLPTTVGSSRTSFLLLFDLAGSSELSKDTSAKAKAYGDFYDAVNTKVQSLLGGLVRKTIGDAVIVTWDGTDVKLEETENFLEALEEVTRFADNVARDVGCKGARALLHHGSYFFGLVGTSTFGQIDVIGNAIDEVCKGEGAMKVLSLHGRPAKLALSGAACIQLGQLRPADFTRLGYTDLSNHIDGPLRLSFAKSIEVNYAG